MDTTSFFVSGAYSSADERLKGFGQPDGANEASATLIAITDGYSRDHREDLKQWMLALQPLDGNSHDKVSLIGAVTAIQIQLREAEGEPSGYVSDNGIYSEPNMRQLNAADVKWVS